MNDASLSTTTSLRDVILDAARDLLLEHGYAGITMRRVADRIGYSATSIYLYFLNKDALLHALIDDGMMRLSQAIVEAREAATGAREKLRAMCGAYVRFGLDTPAYYEVMFTLHPRMMERYPAEKYRAARRNLDLFADALRDASGEDRPTPSDAQMMASVVWASLHGVVMLVLAQRLDARLDPDAFVEVAVDHTLRGLLPVP